MKAWFHGWNLEVCNSRCRGVDPVYFNGCVRLLAAAVKVQKSNHHHWDQSSNYCHPPHASHSKTWSSPSHPHNQQDHCKCKLSLVTALLLAARHHSRSLFFCTFVKSFPKRFFPPTLLPHFCLKLRDVSTSVCCCRWHGCESTVTVVWFTLTVPAFWYV